jgi:predicted Ser/Thr protein kinase
MYFLFALLIRYWRVVAWGVVFIYIYPLILFALVAGLVIYGVALGIIGAALSYFSMRYRNWLLRQPGYIAYLSGLPGMNTNAPITLALTSFFYLSSWSIVTIPFIYTSSIDLEMFFSFSVIGLFGIAFLFGRLVFGWKLPAPASFSKPQTPPNNVLSNNRSIPSGSPLPNSGATRNPSNNQSFVDRYKFGQVIGHGGVSTVYEAIDTFSNRRCAIKEIHFASAADKKQIETEIRILNQNSINFSFMPDIYDVYKEQTRIFIAMAYIDGSTLDALSTRPRKTNQVEDFLITILGFLSQLHDAGIIHRDIKPQNIKKTPDGKYVLLDFGIAKQGAATKTAAKGMASIDYAPVEQLRGQITDARSDLFSLGATAYHLLTARPPANVIDRLSGNILASPSQISKNISPYLENAIMHMLQINPQDRPANAQSVLLSLLQSGTTSAGKPTIKIKT